MKPFRLSIALALMLGIIHFQASAQVTYIGQFKVTVYSQTDPTPPTDPVSYYFGVTLNSDPAFAISLPMVFTPSQTTDGEFIMNENGPQDFGFGSPSYPDKTDFDNDYPNGDYDYFVDWPCTNGNIMSEDLYIDLPQNDLYSSTIPAFSADTYQAFQQVDPSQDVLISWAPYVAEPGADLAHTFIGTYDNQTYNSAYGGFNFDCDTDQTSVIMPGGSLDYGRSYTMNLYYSNRLQPDDVDNSDGTGVFVIIGFDDLTQITITTIPATLQIGVTNQCATLSWPAAATNYKLQSTCDLSTGIWNDVTNNPNIVGSFNQVMVSAKKSAAFFKLTSL